jgi:hypothetical protein
VFIRGKYNLLKGIRERLIIDFKANKSKRVENTYHAKSKKVLFFFNTFSKGENTWGIVK